MHPPIVDVNASNLRKLAAANRKQNRGFCTSGRWLLQGLLHLPEHFTPLPPLILHVLDQVRIDIHRHADSRMAEAQLGDLGVDFHPAPK